MIAFFIVNREYLASEQTSNVDKFLLWMCEKYEYKLKYALTKVPSADFIIS